MEMESPDGTPARLEVLHDTWMRDVVAVTDGIDLDLAGPSCTYRPEPDSSTLVAGDDLHELADIGLLVGNLHALTAQNVGRTNENRIAKLVSRLDSFFLGHNRVARRTRDTALSRITSNFSRSSAASIDHAGVPRIGTPSFSR